MQAVHNTCPAHCNDHVKHILLAYACVIFIIFPTGDLTFEEFAKSSLGEELMPPEEVVTGAELVAGEESRTGGEDGDRSSAMDNDSAAKQAEQFATELSRSTTLRKRNLMTSSLGVSKCTCFVTICYCWDLSCVKVILTLRADCLYNCFMCFIEESVRA